MFCLSKSGTKFLILTKTFFFLSHQIGAPINKVKLANHRRQVLQGIQETSLSSVSKFKQDNSLNGDLDTESQFSNPEYFLNETFMLK